MSGAMAQAGMFSQLGASAYWDGSSWVGITIPPPDRSLANALARRSSLRQGHIPDSGLSNEMHTWAWLLVGCRVNRDGLDCSVCKPTTGPWTK